MIRPTSIGGAAFGDRADGDGRTDVTARSRLSHELGITDAWATLRQVHGATVIRVQCPGFAGDGDAIVTDVVGLPIVVATADCVPIVVGGSGSIAVIHAGWRGIAAGTVTETLDRMRIDGDPAQRAVIGPHIGPCCYEVGEEVSEVVGHRAATTWGTPSVDLRSAVTDQLRGLEIEQIDACTHHDERYASFRRDGTSERQVTVAWLT